MRAPAYDSRSPIAVEKSRVGKVARSVAAFVSRALVRELIRWPLCRNSGSRSSCNPLFFLLRLSPQSLGDTVVPLHHSLIRLVREGFLWQELGERLVLLGIDDVELSNGILKKRYMLLWTQQKLNRLPGDISLPFQRRYGRRPVSVIIRRWLYGVEASKGLVDEGDGGWEGLVE